MKRQELEHILRAAAAITGETEIVVLGSQAALVQFPTLPKELTGSVELDVYPLVHPEKADDIDGAIGELSRFHEEYGYYADGVGPDTALLPRDWATRAIRLHNENMGTAVAIAPEVNDLAVSKLLAGREKDLEWVGAAIRHKIASPERMRTLIRAVDADPARLDQAKARLRQMQRSSIA